MSMEEYLLPEPVEGRWSSSGRGSKRKLLGGRATWLVEPEYNLRSVCLGVKGLLVSTVRNADLVSLEKGNVLFDK